jgi:hypothetical protein
MSCTSQLDRPFFPLSPYLKEIAMNFAALNRICWTVCIICIVAGTTLSISMIWSTYESEFLWKAWLTIGVLFFASLATLVVSKVVGGKGWHSASPQ